MRDVDEAVAERMARQQVLYQRDRKVHIVVTEAAMWYRLAPVEVMAAQLDRLIAGTTAHSFRFGVIPRSTEYGAVPPSHGFIVYDEELVRVETLTAELHIGDEHEVATYLRYFADLARRAVYGAEARAVIAAVAEELTR